MGGHRSIGLQFAVSIDQACAFDDRRQIRLVGDVEEDTGSASEESGDE
jgi:hypothetical protein